MSSNKILVTKNYRQFARSSENRIMNEPKHRRLRASMKEYGFLRSFPISCHYDEKLGIVVADGQHRSP